MKIKPSSLYLRGSETDAPDGTLRESINIHYRDGSIKPIPYRLESTINTNGYSNIIAHKFGDEDTINILGFNSEGDLWKLGVIENGVFLQSAELLYDSLMTEGMSYTILNGILYFMGDGRSEDEQYYIQSQYDEVSETYEFADMYDWKGINGRFNYTSDFDTFPTGFRYFFCGLGLMRYSLVLKSGEEVLHSPIYPFSYGGVMPTSVIPSGELIENIHSYMKFGLRFSTQELPIIRDRISSVKIYCTIPDYYTETTDTTPRMGVEEIVTKINSKTNDEFFLVAQHNIEDVVDSQFVEIMLTVGSYTSEYKEDVGKLDASVIAAGSVMPVDNFTHHKIYGKISSYNGRLIIKSPITVMTSGYLASIMTTVKDTAITDNSNSFAADTEDGNVTGVRETFDSGSVDSAYTIGLVSYPDARAEIVYHGFQDGGTIPILLSRIYSLSPADNKNIAISTSFIVDTASIFTNYNIFVKESPLFGASYADGKGSYDSNNRLQFSEAGEYSVFPAINSYRVGEGTLMFVGSNKVNPESADVVAPLIIGSSDGIYTLNLDLTGTYLVNSITKSANLAVLSRFTLELEGVLIAATDKGLVVVNNGDVVNLTEAIFPSQGQDGDDYSEAAIYPNYDNCIGTEPKGTGYNFIFPTRYKIDDIVEYMKGAKFAYDARRDSIWCCNSSYDYSFLYSLARQEWSLSTIIFDDVVELFSSLIIDEKNYYTRYLIKGVAASVSSPDLSQPSDNLLLLSAEDTVSNVTYHTLTRPMKLGVEDVYKKINRFVFRCNINKSSDTSIVNRFTMGIWGLQDMVRGAEAIPLVCINDITNYKNDIRKDIPIGRLKGKYKGITILQSGVCDPDSTLEGYDFDISTVDDDKLR